MIYIVWTFENKENCVKIPEKKEEVTTCCNGIVYEHHDEEMAANFILFPCFDLGLNDK